MNTYEIEIRDYTKTSPKGRAAGRRCTTYAVVATDLAGALDKASRTHSRRVADGDLIPWVKNLGAAPATGTYRIDYQIL